MKLRLDEYYSIISSTWEGIENYMPKDMVKELLKFELSHNYYEISDYLENLYSYIEVIDTKYNTLDIDLEKLYYNMVEAKADWLYELPAWNKLLSVERRKELFKQQKQSGTIVKEKKVGRNDPCPCGSGKKYKFCCGGG